MTRAESLTKCDVMRLPKQIRLSHETLMRRLASTVQLMVLWLVPMVGAARAAPPPAALRGLLLDACVVDTLVFAVGEHGALIRSDDSGATWTSIRLPIGGTLTGIKFSDTRHGWIVGQEAIILFTADSGRSWSQQAVAAPADAAFLDLHVADGIHVAVIGGFGSFYATSDAGQTWKVRKVQEADLHLNGAARGKGAEFFVAGERGTLLRFPDFRAEPVTLTTGYEGSLNGVLVLADGGLLTYGLQGHAFRSEDNGLSWIAVSGIPPVLLSAAVQLKSGTIVLAGQARALLLSNDGGRSFSRWETPIATAIAKLIVAPDGSLLAFGEGGVSRLPAPPVELTK